MKTALLAILLVFVTRVGGQNLISDNSFEGFPGCVGELSWWGPTNCNNCTANWFPAHAGTPDIMCVAPKTGSKHAGIFTYESNAKCEYIENKLNAPLVANKYYYVEMFVRLSSESTVAISELGFYFCQGPFVDHALGFTLPLTPQAIGSRTGGYSDKNNYMKVSACFQAQGGEDHVVLGNFKNHSNVTLTQLPGYRGDGTDATYYYIDDVTVREMEINEFPLGADTSICQGEIINFNLTEEASTYLWNDGYTGSAYSTTTPGTYWVEINNGCMQVKDTIVIDVKENCDNTLYYPNTFTPNGDNINDVFTISGSNIKEIKMSIYNRWGNKIFENTPGNYTWDGKLNGNIVLQDVFVAVIECSWINGETKKNFTHINVIK